MNNGDMPAIPTNFEGENYQLGGLTMREYFAGLVLQGLVSDYRYYETRNPDVKASEHFASQAVFMADALLADLAK